MECFLVRSLILNVFVLLVAGALIQWYPKRSGFTITTATQTHYITSGVFLGYALVCLFDLAIGIVLAWRIWHPH